jgi:hypothetical protein
MGGRRDRYYRKVARRLSTRLGGPVAPVLGVIRGTAPGGSQRLVILTERNLYVTKKMTLSPSASVPGEVMMKEPIESVRVGFEPGKPVSTLSVQGKAISFMGQGRRAKEIVDAVSAVQSNTETHP